MIFAAAGVLIVLLFLIDLRVCLFVALMVAMIEIDLFAWMYFNNINLDSVSYVQLVMAVGLTVDYC